jgi:hypothetical protein
VGSEGLQGFTFGQINVGDIGGMISDMDHSVRRILGDGGAVEKSIADINTFVHQLMRSQVTAIIYVMAMDEKLEASITRLKRMNNGINEIRDLIQGRQLKIPTHIH